mmetsp:Transcript_8120/g.20365  ORF Transcript_8120/g.20365 Transcript_8120/m.20365 type:complete len:129 (-) Transcript_8120:3261-3647(-)
MRARRKDEDSMSQALHTWKKPSLFILYVAGSIFEGHVVVQFEQTQTPQFLQCDARRNTANLTSQMEHFGLSAKGFMRGGDQARLRHMACFLVGTENALRDCELSCTLFVSRAFWFVLIVATQDFVASE